MNLDRDEILRGVDTLRTRLSEPASRGPALQRGSSTRRLELIFGE